MNDQCRAHPGEFRFRCCDATVITMGLLVALGSVFRQEITFFLLGG